MSRLEKIERDIERAQEKARQWQARAKELDGQLTEAENTEIVSAIRAMKMTRAELRAFVNTGKPPVTLADAAAIPAARFEKKPEAAKVVEPVKDDGGKQGSISEGKQTMTAPAANITNHVTNSVTKNVTNKESEEKTHEA